MPKGKPIAPKSDPLNLIVTILSLLNRKWKRMGAINFNSQKAWSKLTFYWKIVHSSGLQRPTDKNILDTVHSSLIGAWEYSFRREHDKDYPL